MKNLYLLTLAATLVLAGCKKDDTPDSPPPTPEPEPELELTVEQTEYTLGAVEERTATAVFTAKNDWTLSVVYDNAATEAATDDETATEAAWLTVTPASGAAGEQTVELTAAPKITEESRTAYVDIACGEESVRLTVTQTGASDETNFSALFAPEFAQKLQGLEIISDAEKISLEDMAKIAEVTKLDVSRSSLTSLQGIEYFESLTELRCYFNSLESLDVSQNTALTYLDCAYNKLTSLDVSNNTKLESLHCYSNQLTTLDVSGCTALAWLYCSSNQLTSLDVSGCAALTVLDCLSNQLTSLDVSGCAALTVLDCYSNQLTSLDVSNNTELRSLHCSSNQLKELDISKNTALTELYCEDNPGDGESVFPVTVWGDNATKPESLYIPYTSWTYEDKTIAIDYQTATAE